MRLAFVTPRYGDRIVGGAETLVRGLATHLAAAHHDITVLTTASSDHVSWPNDMPAGDAVEHGVRVRRFPVTRAKDHALMARYEPVLAAGLRLPETAEEEWIDNTGYSEPMLAAIAATADAVDALVFAPYLLASTVRGAALRPDRSVVIPCIHDEPYAHFRSTVNVLRGAAGLIFNSDAEAATAATLLGDMPPHATVGAGFDPPGELDPAAFRARHGVSGDFVAYAGRRERGKNFPLLLEWTAARAVCDGARPLALVTMGGGHAPVPGGFPVAIHDAGFVAHGEMMSGLAAATMVANLSVNESFSYLVMESWLAGTPVIVHSACAVTREHCENSGGGIWVDSAEGWIEATTRLLEDPALRATLARRGRAYVETHYSWPAVLSRFESAIRGFVS